MLLRILLFSGLVLHKLIWEIWKRKFPTGGVPGTTTAAKKILKLGKIGFLIFLMVQTLFLNLFPILEEPFFLRVSGSGLFFLGLSVSIAGRVRLGKNWTDLEDRRVLPTQELVEAGIYRLIRHPIYLGDVLLVTGLEIALNSWLFLLGIPIAMIVVRQALQEEELLLSAFPEYRKYCARTKRFLPFVV